MPRRIGIAPGLLLLACLAAEPGPTDPERYRRYSRFTDPGKLAHLLADLSEDPVGIARVAGRLTVHHNLLPYHGIPKSDWPAMRRVWPPKMPELLAALEETEPGSLLAERPIEQRLVGACMMESHLLAGMLRAKRIAVRPRAGYFRNVQADAQHVVQFWENTLRARGIEQELLEQDPERWRREINDYTRQQIEIDKRIEHWVTEYWDESRESWRILDANTTFLEASSNLQVDVHLPRRYFEYAHEAWQRMRTAEDFNPDQYAEWPQDGRSHIRSQLLWDFYSLLQHDIGGYDQDAWPEADSTNAERDAYAFIKERQFEELSPQELDELDRLAELLAGEPPIESLIAFYRGSRTLRLPTVEQDRYSFVFGG